ncbi:MAG: ISAs1 family transposase [Gammaproteobacteria bacterium]|nr:MAG: ISAs1 family transposase [Gammaproteobacteria bacterium]RKZ70927.1 MAG: ISAs1 family transposase [Gammaproteobacteria bacterium]
MSQYLTTVIEEHFKSLPDPRRKTMNLRHKLIDILIIAICAIICGSDSWVAVETFGKAKEDWFRRFLELPNGIPSHDTFTDVFRKLASRQFEACFTSWTESISELFEGEVVSIDGKTLRRSHDKGNDKKAIHMVSAWASKNYLVLGQVKTDDKSNEITAIPKLLLGLELKGCLVTIDAMGCQKKIAKVIIDQEADYLLAVKDNQPKLYQAVQDYFTQVNKVNFEGYNVDFAETNNEGHGRIETRRCWVGHDALPQIEGSENWEGLQTIVMLESERTVKEETTIEHRYYISSTESSAESLLCASREHWGIENSWHWRLDIAFREDESRIRKGNGAENLAILRHIALNLLNKEDTAKLGMKNKRLKAGWDASYLEKVLAGLAL